MALRNLSVSYWGGFFAEESGHLFFTLRFNIEEAEFGSGAVGIGGSGQIFTSVFADLCPLNEESEVLSFVLFEVSMRDLDLNALFLPREHRRSRRNDAALEPGFGSFNDDEALRFNDESWRSFAFIKI